MVNRTTDCNKNAHGNKSESHVTEKTDETPEMMSAGFEESGGAGLGVENVSRESAAGGENHKNRENYGVMKNDRAGSFERRVRLHCKFHNGGEIVSVYKTF